ncbi:hypothetical protein [Pyxidicoccus sp. MSG2]|uniref:hypothetical protein n=1 Tax=Pyxidicoccus sp. MSG2 TaxID=2996790 RepID=UPI0022712FDC|nr:hypothetical protein [Pyxidicoccus sp. MSG2]MCY1023561.1 hypothetical protein [Pyxidicoccus sp. MSG2]
MKNLRWLLCAVALSVVGCGAPMEMEEETSTESPAAETPEGQVSQAATTCTEAWGQCRVGQCEPGTNGTFQTYTKTCCTDAGACTTQRLRICGC